MKRGLATRAIAASLFAPAAQANDALEAKVRAYVPVVSLAKVCDIRINDATSGDHRAMLEVVKSDPSANKLAYRLPFRNADGLHQGSRPGSTGRLLQGLHRSQQPIRQGTLHRGGRGPYGRRQHECAESDCPQRLRRAPRQAVQGRLETVRRSSKGCFRTSKSWPRKTPRRTAGT